MMIEGFIFDMDGTLVDSIIAHALSAKEACEQYGYNLSLEEYIKEVGRSFVDIISTIAKKRNITLQEEDIKKLRELKTNLFISKYINNIKLLPGVIDILSLLKSHGYKVALASSSSIKEIESVLNKFELKKYFDVVVSREMVQKAKPDPEIFLKAANLLGINPKDAIVFEDSDYGIIAAKKGGFTAYGLLTGKCTKEQLERVGADKVFQNLIEAAKYIKSQIIFK